MPRGRRRCNSSSNMGRKPAREPVAVEERRLRCSSLRRGGGRRGCRGVMRRFAGSLGRSRSLSLSPVQKAVRILRLLLALPYSCSARHQLTIASYAERAKVRRAMEQTLLTTAMKIVTFANTHKDHIPPITTQGSNPFPYKINVDQKETGWATRMRIY